MIRVIPPSTMDVHRESAAGEFVMLVLDSLHANYNTVTGALQIESTQDASHNSNIKVVRALNTTGGRVGDLASIARDQLGVGVFKDEFVSAADWNLRAPGLLGVGDYADQVWYVRPRTTYSTTDGSPTNQITYGDASGKTYGDALSGRVGYNAALASITGPARVYFAGEHIIGTEDMRVDTETVTGVGQISIDESGTDTNVRHEIRFDYPDITHNGVTLDRGVYYGGLMLNDTTKPWVNGVVKMPYTETVALVEGDRFLTITMDTDLDTGQILDWTGTDIWILTDGTAGNSFDNSPTSNGTFTITAGTGDGSQNGAATAESNIWTYPSLPGNMPGGVWCYDPGTAFGNGVHKDTYSNKTGTFGTLTVQDADGGVQLRQRDTMALLSSNPGSVFRQGASTGDPIAVHLPSGADPTDRVMAPGFGLRLVFAETISHVNLIGERARWLQSTQSGNTRVFPRDNFKVEDFSRKFSGNFLFDMRLGDAPIAATRTNLELINGYLGRATGGIYPIRGEVAGDIYIIDGFTAQDLFIEKMGGEVSEETNGDGVGIGFQGNAKDITVQRCIINECGQSLHPYQFGEWVTFTTHHEWGTCLFEDIDIDGTSTLFPNAGQAAFDVGFHLGGDNVDEASIGNGKATPPTTKQDVSNITVRRVKVRNKYIGVRDKWRDFNTVYSALDLDSNTLADFAFAGGDTASANVVRLPYTESTPLVAGDVGKVITMDTDGDTGTIIDYDASDILIITDGTAANNFDNSPTPNDTFTITTGTGAGSQNGAGAYEPTRGPRAQIRSSTFGGNSTAFFSGLPTADDSTDEVIDSDLNTFVTTAANTLFQGQTFAQWQANSRTGSTYDPSSTRQDP